MNEYVQAKVQTPGMALAALGVLMLLLQCVAGALSAAGAVTGVMAQMAAEVDMGTIIASFFQGSGSAVVVALFGMLSGVIILLGGLRLRSAKSASLVYAGAILAMLPCCSSWCCVAGLPIGIWVIMTMRDEQVREAFAA
jgi:hypothetical protein